VAADAASGSRRTSWVFAAATPHDRDTTYRIVISVPKACRGTRTAGSMAPPVASGRTWRMPRRRQDRVVARPTGYPRSRSDRSFRGRAVSPAAKTQGRSVEILKQRSRHGFFCRSQFDVLHGSGQCRVPCRFDRSPRRAIGRPRGPTRLREVVRRAESPRPCPVFAHHRLRCASPASQIAP